MSYQMLDHIIIEAVTPSVDGGRYPAKRIVGERCVVEADVYRDGHQVVAAALKWQPKSGGALAESRMRHLENDRWRGEFPLDENTRYLFTIEAWTDQFASWLGDFSKWVEAGRDITSDLLEGMELIESTLRRARGRDRNELSAALAGLKSVKDPRRVLELVTAPQLLEIMSRLGERSGATVYEPMLEVVADRPKARFSAWYEMFARSQGPVPGKHATFREAEARLAEIRDMGFDVLYLAPIHPIGRTNRKGPNNTLEARPDSPGSPWAIGSKQGGHMAIEPGLGTLADFDHFVAAAGRLGLEIAMDFAIQTSPDHPWVKQHPEWFHHRPDGTIKYAENPPKEYQDIYPINFDTPGQQALMEELCRTVMFWIGRGVRIFRVDNPHTKPVAFWKWLIEQVQAEHPDTIFLSEAFTRPKMMKALAKAGFTQSYTYFTWRNTKFELTEYLSELTQSEMREYLRPNFFTNTPDILSPVLQRGGRPAFKMRLVLAATLSPSYGIYSGFELCENEAVAGTEEYLNSEKYESKARDWNRPGNIKEFISRVNAIRRDNPALHDFTNLRFLTTDNDQMISYVKATPDGSNVILVAVNLDPLNPNYCTTVVPPDWVGVGPGQSFQVTDLITGASYVWSEHNYVRLDPQIEPAHILRLDKRL